ncbi:MAG: hypothetical protein EX272_12045 [Chromatiales bacterium]|nr:MAG: hypothetical protein EX272_12045 [Chromatiales bacterium]
MRKLIWLSVVSILAVALMTPAVADKSKMKDVPFKATFSGYLTGFGPVPDGRCDNPPEGKVAYALASFEGWGNATHAGYSFISAEHCSYWDLNAGMADGTYGQGQMTLVAANGDVLRISYIDGVSLSGPPVVEFMDYFTFEDGGTGRFTFASGGGVDIGSVDFSTYIFEMRMEGVIAYKKR